VHHRGNDVRRRFVRELQNVFAEIGPEHVQALAERR
jgi:hypothetical protein